MPEYLSPGIYVEEVKSGARPIEMVGTRTAAFIGVAPDSSRFVETPRACNNPSEFERLFNPSGKESTVLSRAVHGFFDNGGSRCYVLNIGEKGTVAGDARKRSGVHALASIDEIAMVAAPGATDAAAYEALLSHCEGMGDRFAILDAAEGARENPDALKEVAGATAADADEEGGSSRRRASSGLRPRASSYGAFYFPWLVVSDKYSGKPVTQPPSGHLAGVYARTDATRGVHKAPANEPIRQALGLTYQVTHAEQGELNRAGVNCIRFFSDSGILIWGARTLDEAASEYRYIPVRRTMLALRESIQDGTRWAVFEPNDENTWKTVERDIRAFLTLQWRAGALMGATPEQAFYVKCDAETNPPEVIDAGQMVTEIGVAPVKPAEFVIFRVSQWSGETATVTAAEAEA
ncbi:MAG: phage tail sheath family protein [Chromatiales bacterium]|nr:phage tail sheath family protein [Chromatiales bacterium]